MTYTPASYRASKKWISKNKEYVAQKQAEYGLKFRERHHDEYNARCLHNFRIRQEFARFRNILFEPEPEIL